jgi:flotillin
MPRNRAARNTLCRHPEAERDIAIKRAESQRAAAVAKAQADQEREAAETASLPKQAEANRDLDEAKAKRDLFLARHRRGVALGKAARAQSAFGDHSKSATFDRLQDRVNQTEAIASAEVELLNENAGDRLARLDRDTEVERLLAELKSKHGLLTQ